MCGIAGIIGHQQAGLIETLLQRQAHRGPDGLIYYRNNRIAFGHARLRIIDLTDQANQPMVDPQTGNVLVFNGEIYNYKELRASLVHQYPFVTESDSEVLLAAYACYGIDCLKYLRGMFAFALYDARLQQTVIVRDRFGIKPLYYRRSKDAFYFASEIKSLLGIDGLPAETIHELKAYEFMANCQLDTNEHTLFNEVNQLLPATYVWVDAQGVMHDPVSYWSFPEPGDKLFDEQAQQALIDQFDECMSLHLRSDVPVGGFFSGGLDSGSVVAFAMRHDPQKTWPVFSAILPYHHPENAIIPQVLEKTPRLQSHTYLLDGADFFKDIQSLIFHHDEPVMDGSMFAHYKLCELARQEGIKVLLSGSGGDELFGGYASHIHAGQGNLLRQWKGLTLLREIRKTAANTGMSASHLLVKAMYENWPYALRTSFKNKQLRKKIKHLEQYPEVAHYHHSHPDRYHANLINNYRSWTAPPFLHYEDRNSMAFGVEIRVPFFDHVLIEQVLQYDSAQFVSGRSKQILRQSFKGIVWDEVLDQKGKYGFPSPIDHALKDDPEGKALFYELLPKTPLLNQTKTLALANRFYAGQGDVSVFWRTFSFMIWYDIYFTNRSTWIH